MHSMEIAARPTTLRLDDILDHLASDDGVEQLRQLKQDLQKSGVSFD
jgi:hypothetical protein